MKFSTRIGQVVYGTTKALLWVKWELRLYDTRKFKAFENLLKNFM